MKQRPFEQLKDMTFGKLDLPSSLCEKYEPLPDRMPETLDDEVLFHWAMRDVVPLAKNVAKSSKGPPPGSLTNPNQEALHELHSLVNRKSSLDLTFSDEYIEKALVPGARPLLRELRRGQYAVQGVLDLHGMNRESARTSVESFISQAVVYRFGCVKIIHGRGHNSKENRAVLKEFLQLWLATRRMSRYVLAYTSARACDGGAGAVYVLLRKPRKAAHKKAPR